nr:tripartite tricarboxylate transporter substrate-binding protein [Candidatus Symbiopectobacterium sp. PLON1]
MAANADWPTKTVKLVVPFPPGGGTDLLARALAERLSKSFGQTFVVENRPVAGAAGGTEYVARATDGHTFLFASSNHVTVPALNTHLRYDIFKDFKSISLVSDQASVFAVSPDLPGKTSQKCWRTSKPIRVNTTTAQRALDPASISAPPIYNS